MRTCLFNVIYNDLTLQGTHLEACGKGLVLYLKKKKGCKNPICNL